MAEEIGKRIAQELSDRFARMGLEVLAQQTDIHFAAQTTASLRREITQELRGFNAVAPHDFHLNMLPGQSCLVFSFQSRLVLTLKVENTLVRLVPAPCPGPGDRLQPTIAQNGREVSDFAVSRDDKGFHYRMIAPTSATYPPLLSQSEFIEGVLRVACSQPFDRP